MAIKHINFLSLIFCLLFLVCFGIAHTQNVLVSGQITDNSDQPAAYVKLYFPNAQKNTVTDADGRFYIDLPANSKQTLKISDARYKLFKIEFIVGQNDFTLDLEVELKTNNYSKSFTSADSTNFANAVIKAAVNKRAYHLNQFEKYKATTYQNTKVVVDSVKNNFPRFWILSSIPDLSKLGIAYIDETISTIYFNNAPYGFLEKVTASRSDGRLKNFTFNARLLLTMNFYNNTVEFPSFNEMTYQAPISWATFLFYRFKLDSTYLLDSDTVYRIKISPKNRYSRVFSGYIDIRNHYWNIVEVNLTAPKTSSLWKVDSIQVFKRFVNYDQFHYRPDSLCLTAWKTIYGATWHYQSSINWKSFVAYAKISEKKVKKAKYTHWPKSVINRHVDFWKKHRNGHLTINEKNFFIDFDSTRKSRQEKADESPFINFKQKKFHWTYPLLGQTFYSADGTFSLYFDGLLNDKIEYNTVEGFTYKYTIFLTKVFDNNWKLEFEPTLRYGFADNKFKAKAFFRFSQPKHFQTIELDGGRYYFQINPSQPIHPIINSIYTLFLRQNFMKLYAKDYIRINYERELLNGLYLSVGTEWAQRRTLENHTYFSFFSPSDNYFTLNNPNAYDNPKSYRLLNSRAWTANVGLTFKPNQLYIKQYEKKHILGSKIPAISLFYTKGIPVALGSDINYDLLEFTITGDAYLNIFGKSSYIIKAGIYLNNKKMTYLDYTHFIGERGYFLGSAVNGTVLAQFKALAYYKYSTNKPFIELHFQHDFKQYLLNQVPLVKKLEWNLLVGFNFLQLFNGPKTNYSEFYIGLDNLFGFISQVEMINARFDVALQFVDGSTVIPSYLFGISTRFGELFK